MEEKFQKIIKEIRIKNNLTQNEFANMLGVTYQAVSKWENGKSIPDILMLKEISSRFNVDLNYLINGNNNIPYKNNNQKNKLLIIIIALLTIIAFMIVCYFVCHKHNYEFKSLNGEISDIKVQGSVTYDENKSSIFLNIDYKKDDKKIYKSVECVLYEKYKDILNIISTYNYDNSSEETLKDILKNVNFVVNNYSPSCKNYENSELYLEINAKIDDEKTLTYKIPITFENC